MRSHRNHRKRKLVAPALQLKLVGVFAGLATASILLNLFLLGLDLRGVAQGLPDPSGLEREIPVVLERSLAFTLGMWLPVTIAVGIIVTHRVAGPVYRFERHLESVIRGERPGPCRIREEDELQELCALLNQALETAYASAPHDAASGPAQEPEVAHERATAEGAA